MSSTAASNSDREESLGLPLASLGSRLLAQIIDGVVGAFPLMIVIAMSEGSNAIGGLAVLLFFLFVAYYLFCDGLPNGQSLGKRLLNIRVVIDETNLPCTYWKSFLRNIAQVLGVLDWLWIFGAKRKRAPLLTRALRARVLTRWRAVAEFGSYAVSG